MFFMLVREHVQALLDDPHASHCVFMQRLLAVSEPSGWGVSTYAVNCVLYFRQQVRRLFEAALGSVDAGSVLVNREDELRDAFELIRQCKRSWFVHDNSQPMLHDQCVVPRKDQRGVFVMACCKGKPPTFCKCKRFRVCASCCRVCSLCEEAVCDQCEKGGWVQDECVCRECRYSNEILVDVSSDDESE